MPIFAIGSDEKRLGFGFSVFLASRDLLSHKSGKENSAERSSN